MVNRQTALKIRKTHRYLGLFLGIQFLLWTISGLYFSWTNIDEIHGDHFKKEFKSKEFNEFINLDELNPKTTINSLSLKEIDDEAYYWVNKKYLYNAKTGKIKNGISKTEALSIAKNHIKNEFKVKDIKLIYKTGKHHEYREQLLPAYVISYDNKSNLKVYISKNDGAFKRVRHRNWRIFDFLWMTHTMDYQGRDNINTLTLRIFSLLGLITVSSGFLLWFTTSPSIRKVLKK